MSLSPSFESNQFAVILLNMTLILDLLEAAEVSLLKKIHADYSKVRGSCLRKIHDPSTVSISRQPTVLILCFPFCSFTEESLNGSHFSLLI